MTTAPPHGPPHADRFMSPWIDARDGYVRIHVRAQPRASRSEVAGEYAGAIRIRIAAPPVDGEANAELIRFLAKTLDVPARAIRIRSGGSARTKLVEVDGVTVDHVRARLLG